MNRQIEVSGNKFIIKELSPASNASSNGSLQQQMHHQRTKSPAINASSKSRLLQQMHHQIAVSCNKCIIK
jgi:hypothetical protein